tara:strand:+ start:441 stop:644 length:204 start_codon:yes stop_codon:yes gene_type:complete
MTNRRYAIQLIFDDNEPNGFDTSEEVIDFLKECWFEEEGSNHYLISATSEEVPEGERVRPLLVQEDD